MHHAWIKDTCLTTLLLLAMWTAHAAPVGGSSERSASASRGRAQAQAVTEPFDMCAHVWVPSGNISFLTMVSTPPVQNWTLPTLQAGVTSYADIESYIKFGSSLYATDHTGSLRWSLWALPANRVAGWPYIKGHRLGGFQLKLIDPQGVTRDYLLNDTEVTLRERVTTLNPPAGSYCMAFVLEVYAPTANCGSADAYCPAYLYVSTPMVTFR